MRCLQIVCKQTQVMPLQQDKCRQLRGDRCTAVKFNFCCFELQPLQHFLPRRNFNITNGDSFQTGSLIGMNNSVKRYSSRPVGQGIVLKCLSEVPPTSSSDSGTCISLSG